MSSDLTWRMKIQLFEDHAETSGIFSSENITVMQKYQENQRLRECRTTQLSLASEMENWGFYGWGRANT